MGNKKETYDSLCIKDYERRNAPQYKQRDYVQEKASALAENAYRTQMDASKDTMDRSQFLSNAKNWLFEECIYRIYDSVMNVCLDEAANTYITEDMKRAVVHNFVVENGGTRKLLRRFYDYNVLLSEIYQCVEHYYDIIVEAVSRKDSPCKDSDGYYKIPSDVQDKFYKELDGADFTDVSMQISTRVIDAIDNFVTDNNETMNNIRDILQTTKEKVEASKKTIKSNNEAAMLESSAERDIIRLKQNRKMNLFSYMIEATAKSVMKSDAVRESFLNKATLDIDKIKAYVTTTYTMLETANSLNMIYVDENYIRNIIDNM